MTTRDAPTPTPEPPGSPASSEPDGTPAAHRRLARFDLTATQLIATALAAITATIVASYLGVSGTVIGAALASVVSAVGNAVYGHSLRTTRDRVRVDRVFLRERRRDGAPAAPAEEKVIVEPPVLPAAPRPARPRTETRPQTAWRRVAIASVASFVAVLAVVTGVEVVAGRPLSDLLRGNAGTGTSVFGSAGGAGATTPAGTPTVTRTVTPAVVVTTPTVTTTAPAVTSTATPTQTPTASPSAPGSGTPSSTGSAGSTPAP